MMKENIYKSHVTIKRVKKQIEQALQAVNKEITDNTDRENPFSVGMATEGRLGGYAQALRDVLLVLGQRPSPEGDGL
jgi:hypothetical protein